MKQIYVTVYTSGNTLLGNKIARNVLDGETTFEAASDTACEIAKENGLSWSNVLVCYSLTLEGENTPKLIPNKPNIIKELKSFSDFKMYYDSSYKRNYWMLGYFGGGSVNVSEAYEVAKQFSKDVGVSLESIKIDEILKSRRFKGFKIMYSSIENQEPQKDSIVSENVYAYLTD